MANASIGALDITTGRNPGLVASLLTRVRTYRHDLAERSRVRMELESYSDRQLADLGITRGDIRSIADREDLR